MCAIRTSAISEMTVSVFYPEHNTKESTLAKYADGVKSFPLLNSLRCETCKKKKIGIHVSIQPFIEKPFVDDFRIYERE